MGAFYRFINWSERKQLWSILLCQITLVTFSWYYIEKMQSNNECSEMLRQDYNFISPYINVPDNCTWWTIFWFRVNRYTVYTVVLLFVHVLNEYYISLYHTIMYVYTWVGLMVNTDRTHRQNNIFYRDAPYLLCVLSMILYLEKKPFNDLKAIKRSLDIDMVNDERLFALEKANSQCWSETIGKIRQCESNVKIQEIIRQMDEQIAKNHLIYQLSDNPVFPRPEQKKTTSFLICLFMEYYFFLCALAVWNYILLFY
ncbi:unnamed protein product [Rotaria sordida]|uniref:Uncharacterized protein n=1 Tax=Rotaria sordida TaxID=392033 RepID=A0A814P5C2_9BILA|nr:unnamed protein product [Rotaria sordida]CAF1308158.1 unnamed protein product [Rotaria sordida]